MVELASQTIVPLGIYLKTRATRPCSGISFIDLTPLRVCYNRRIHNHKMFGISCFMGSSCTRLQYRSRNRFMFTPASTDAILLRKRAICETIIDELKKISQNEHFRHRSPGNFLTNLFSALIAYKFYLEKAQSQTNSMSIPGNCCYFK